MQDLLDPSFLIKLLLTVFLLATFMWLFIYLTRTRSREIRRGGIYNAFNNDDEGEQNASRMDIQASEIDSAFNNKKRAKQNVEGTRITSGQSSQAANSEVYRLNNTLLQFIAYLFSGGKSPANSKGKQI